MRQKSGMKKVITNIMLLAAVFCMFLSAKGISALAAGSAYDFDFAFSEAGEWITTQVVPKDTADYVSMKCTWAELDGSSYTAYASDAYGNNRGDSVQFYEGTWALLTNYIHENGSDTAKINATLDWDTGYGAIFQGYWYADSGIQ